MPQTSERKRQYAKERYLQKGAALRAKQAEWRARNREHLKNTSAQRRLTKRAACLVAAARVRARKKRIAFNLTASDVEAIQRTINAGVCEVSGVSLVLAGPRGPYSPSLDRINPALGYVSGNVRVVAWALNCAMGDWGLGPVLHIVGNAIVSEVAATFIKAVMQTLEMQ